MRVRVRVTATARVTVAVTERDRVTVTVTMHNTVCVRSVMSLVRSLGYAVQCRAMLCYAAQ